MAGVQHLDEFASDLQSDSIGAALVRSSSMRVCACTACTRACVPLPFPC
jgi:hypothetical protein